MRKLALVLAVLIGSVLVGALSYESFMYQTYQPRGQDLAEEEAKSCSQSSDCPQIYCIRAPCPYNVCSDGVCKVVSPEGDYGYDKSCSTDADCKLMPADCSACSLIAVNIGQSETLDCSGYNGSVCRVAPLKVSCDAGKCTSVPYSR